jgi:hypothetical protein
MPDMKSAEDRIFWLTRCRLAHVYEFFREIPKIHSRFQKLHVFEFDQDAV